MDSSNAALLLTSRDDIMQQIAVQAASVRRQFEAHPSRRKHTVSSATAAAAQHMASLNRKRKLEVNLNVDGSPLPIGAPETELQRQISGGSVDCVWKQSSHTFHSPIASFTRPEKARQISTSSAPAAIQTIAPVVAPEPEVQRCSSDLAPPRVSDGIILKSTLGELTVSYNDVVCGKGKTTSSLVGNQRYKVWIDLHKEAYAKAFYDEDRRKIAAGIVAAVTTCVPAGRFLSLDIHTGLWYDVGYGRAVGITQETLMAESGMMKSQQMAMARPNLGGSRRTSTPRTLVSKAA